MQRARAGLQPFHCGLRHRSETTAPRPGSIPSRPSPFRVDSARIQWFPSSRKSGKSGSKHKNDLQEARSARLASSQVSSPHASCTCTCLAHTHSLRPRRMSTHAQHVASAELWMHFASQRCGELHAACTASALRAIPMPLALTVAVLTYLLLRRAFDTGIRGRWQGLGAALLPCSPAVPPRVVWSTWEGVGVAGRRGMGSFVHRSCGGIKGAASMVREAVCQLNMSCHSRCACVRFVLNTS